ncbi:MAG: hypothetical protein ACXVBY_13060, partial [Isosphaeraceae bacterium]
ATPESRAQFLHNVIARYFVPRMARFARTAPELAKSVDALCAAPGWNTRPGRVGLPTWPGRFHVWRRRRPP